MQATSMGQRWSKLQRRENSNLNPDDTGEDWDFTSGECPASDTPELSVSDNADVEEPSTSNHDISNLHQPIRYDVIRCETVNVLITLERLQVHHDLTD